MSFVNSGHQPDLPVGSAPCAASSALSLPWHRGQIPPFIINALRLKADPSHQYGLRGFPAERAAMKNGLFFLVRAWHLSPMTAIGPHRFAFGAMQFGGTASAADAAGLYAACRAAGITHFDTAHAYTNGASERLLGDLVRPERDAVFIATKAGYVGGASRQNILSTFDESRQRLQLDHVDLLYLHRFDDATPLEETFETLAKLQADGLITHIGVSNFAAWQVMKAQAVAARLGTSISYIQPMYNLVKRQAEVEILPMAQAEGLVPCTYSPLGGGLLTGKYSTKQAASDGRLATDHRYAARYGLPEMHRAAADLAALAADLGLHPATLAVAWVLQHPAAPLPILSARNAAQLAPSLAAINYNLDADTYARLQAIFPAPPPATDRIEEA